MFKIHSMIFFFCRFSDTRPALIVGLVPFYTTDLHFKLLNESTSIPFLHISEMLLAESSVASSFKKRQT